MSSSLTETVVTFPSGPSSLFGILHGSERGAKVGVLLLVGGPQYRVGSHRMFVQMARCLARGGHPVLRFDFTGMGDSSGAFPGFERVEADIAAALDQFESLCTTLERFVLLGLCDGATAAASYSRTDPRVSGVVLLNPWVHTEHGEAKAFLWHYYPKRVLQRDFWKSLAGGKVSIGASIRDLLRKVRRASGQDGRPLADTGDFIERMRKALVAFKGKVLIAASENDLTASEFVGLWNTDERWRQIREAAEYEFLAGADHTLSNARSLRDFCQAVLNWLKSLQEPAAAR